MFSPLSSAQWKPCGWPHRHVCFVDSMMSRILASAARCCWWCRSQGLRFGIWLALIAFVSPGVGAQLNLALHRHDHRAY
jgi:hypothetical protein